jgi:hypothetical protein
MIKGKVYEYLKTYLGEYLYGLNEEQLDVGLLSGNLNFYNANLKPNRVNSLLMSLGMPFSLKAGLIGNLQLKYHYISWSSKPMDVLIDELFLVLGPVLLKSQEASLARIDTYASDEEDLDPFAGPFSHLNLSRDSESTDDTDNTVVLPPKADEEEGVLQKYFTKVLKNLTLTVKKLHIRYEDETYPYCHPFSFGVTLESLCIRSINSEWSFSNNDEVVANRQSKDSTSKEVVVKKLAAYVNPVSGMLIPTSLWEETQQSQIGIFEAMPACDVRDLLLGEMEMLNSGASPSAVLQPADFALNFVIGTPRVTMIGKLPVVQLSFTSAMAESMRSFFEYFTNVQLWGPMRRFRPCERIVVTPRDRRESRRMKEKRRKIVQKWFHYALKFVKAKQQLVTYVQKLRRKNDRKQRRRNLKSRGQTVVVRPPVQPEVRGPRPASATPCKVNDQPAPYRASDLSSHPRPSVRPMARVNTLPSHSSHHPSLPVNLASRNAAQSVHHDTSSILSNSPRNRDSFLDVLGSRQQRTRPGEASNDISSTVNEYNRSIMQKQLPVQRIANPARVPAPVPAPVIAPVAAQARPVEQPLDLSKFAFMPSFLENSICDVRAGGVYIKYTDEDSQLTLHVNLDPIKGQVKAEPGHLHYALRVDQCQCQLTVDETTSEVFKVGRRQVAVDKENMLSSVFRRQPAKVEVVEVALQIEGTYSPTAFRREGGEFPKANYHDLTISVSPASMAYSKSTLGHLLQLYEAFVIDKAKRESLAVINSPSPYRSPTNRKLKFEVALNRFVLTKAFVEQFIEWQSGIKSTLKEADLEWRDINLHLKAKTARSTLTFTDGVLPILELTIPSGEAEISKVESTTSASLWGLSLSSSRSLVDLHDYFSVRTMQVLTDSLGEKFKRLQRLFELKSSSV